MTEDRLARLEALADQMAGTIAKFAGRSTAHYRNPMAERVAREGQRKPIKKIGPLAAALIPLAGAAIGAVGSAVGGMLSGPGFEYERTEVKTQLTDDGLLDDKSSAEIAQIGAMLQAMGNALADGDPDGLEAAIATIRQRYPFEENGKLPGKPIKKIANTPISERSPLAEYARRQMQRPRGQPVASTFTKDGNSSDALIERLREIVRGAQDGTVQNPWREIGVANRTWPRKSDTR